jgi:hypothetical protein
VVLQNDKMDEFINQWVAPYYLNILHGNYCYRLKDDKRNSFNLSVKNALLTINHEVVNRLLSGGWREQITGSWFCGLKSWSQFADVIGTKLVESKVVYAGQGHSFALACFANNKSVDYFTKYLDIYLPQTNLLYVQTWVMPALMWVDKQNNTNHSVRYFASGSWEKYIADKKSDVWQLNYCKEKFWKLMNYCQENFAIPKVG